MTDLERLTINLTPGTSQALRRIMGREGVSKTDAVNLAVRRYDKLTGKDVYVREDDGTFTLLVFA